MILQESAIDSLAWDKQDGLLPAIVQHARSGAVLMLAYMDREALRATFARGRAVFYSRSRRQLWEKGQGSGHTLQVSSIHADCDGDTLLVRALPAGPACHLGTPTCFGTEPAGDSWPSAFFGELEQIIDSRLAHSPEGSYTARLHARGVRHVAQKVGEEALEVALAAVCEPDDRLIAESADLLFHLLVLLRGRGMGIGAVAAELRARHADRERHAADSR
ncbi:MAG: bifunctional phosphoribosyl-AMP cyclohydrolase/phosphoribosyl-ATP diphosphatase HisIE [Gammaproteobacteria bacterium]|nr:bifunctional phosphoribosyl-AMP cyclohydrolase/phosphoribosyl-ATP diphosphatase HisIE [Gammaproteobacteria bacterium]MDE2250548.1 bifunctional phosphoribosyl-AMP cyclohydrolase/phosphoribosyl-ATP diphosphatase HisIE [Gammaproteobacteria bacterium]